MSHRQDLHQRFVALTIVCNVVLALCIIVLPLYNHRSHQAQPQAVATFAPAPDVTVTVPLAAHGTASQMNLSTNFYDAGEVGGAVDPAHGNLLQEWGPQMVRLHMGFTGDDPSLPEAQYGQWDFTKLDAAISRLRATHTTFFLNVRTGPAWMFAATGQLRDQTYQEFAQYMARLVGWYNVGGFTDEQGHFHASGHQHWVHTWEIWNEPNSGYDIPISFPNPQNTWLDPVSFAALYSTTASAMRAVDPSIQTGGPALSSYPDDRYLTQFIQHITAPLDFLSFHFYAVGNQRSADHTAFDAVDGAFAHRLTLARALLDAQFPGQRVPIWVDEVGYNEIARLPIDPRGAAPVGVAFDAATFIMAEAHGVAQFTQFPFLGNPQLALVDAKTWQPYVPLRLYETLARAFPPGVTLLPMHISQPQGTVALAALAADGASIRVIIANLQVAHPTDVNGTGLTKTVRVIFTGVAGGATPHVGAVATVWSFDATTDPRHPAQAQRVPLFTAGNAILALQSTLRGYGVEVIEIPLTR